MKLSFKFNPNFSHKQLEIVKELSWHCSKLYNIINYKIKNDEEVKPIYTKLEKNFKENWHTDYLHSHNRQQLFKQLAQDWKSYFHSKREYNNNPDKYQGQPKPPNFKHLDNNPCGIVFTNFAVRVREGYLLLSLSKKIKCKYQVDSLKFQLPPAIESLINLNYLQQVRIKRDNLSDDWYLIIIHKVDEKAEAPGENIIGVDLGLDNLATVTFKDNSESYIIDGKVIKSENRYYNRKIKQLQKVRMKQVVSEEFKDTRQIKQFRLKRRNFVIDYLHKASRKIVNLALKNNVGTIVIGDIAGIKQNNIHKKHFVAIPVQRLKDLIEYKAKLEGIKVVFVNEAYTSGCSAIDEEKLNKNNYDKSRRTKRGLFKTGNKIINADVNGSLNIMRKYLKKGTPKMVKQIRDMGEVSTPERLRVS
ncbi:MAG: RNA-guided endonuclease InsQ/TnpB family protein [Bacteroidales bacterium]